jgi:hypothetical protein
VTTNLNTAEDDLQFELLLCLASTIEVVKSLQPIGAGEPGSPGGVVPAQLTTDPTKDDVEFELLLCLTYTIEAIQALLPTGAGGDGEVFEGESEKVLNITRGKWPPRSEETAFSLGSD